jgi:hypothetical protein
MWILDKKLRVDNEIARFQTITINKWLINSQFEVYRRDSSMQKISFLQAHIAQLTQTVQLALPPAKEEAKKKGWWQFWK